MNTIPQPSGRHILTLKGTRPRSKDTAPAPSKNTTEGDSNTSVAGEEDPGAALEFMSADRDQGLPERVRPARCGR